MSPSRIALVALAAVLTLGVIAAVSGELARSDVPPIEVDDSKAVVNRNDVVDEITAVNDDDDDDNTDDAVAADGFTDDNTDDAVAADGFTGDNTGDNTGDDTATGGDTT